MLQNSKNLLFDDGYKLKLENPEMSLDNWMSYIDQKRCTFRVEKKVLKKGLTGTTYGYLVSTNDPLWPNCEPATRSRKDFQTLQNQLEKRFPNAVVPKLARAEVDNLHLTEVFLTELSLNPFFRMDVSFSDFLNGKNTKYNQTKKNDKKHSQGTLRWLQQLTEYPQFELNDDTIISIKQDLQHLKKATETLKSGLAQQMKVQSDMQACAGNMAGSLSAYLAVEQNSDRATNGSVSGLPSGKVQSLVTKYISLHEDYQAGLKQAYDGGSLERLTSNTLTIIQKEIVAFNKLLAKVAQTKKEFDSASANFESLPNESPTKETARENTAQKQIIFVKNKNALGFEVEKFRTYKTIRMQSVFDNLAKFHLRGAKRITEDWSQSKLQLDPQEEQYFFQQDAIYARQDANPVGRNRAPSVAMRTGGSKRINQQKSLIVTKTYKKFKAGDLLTGYQKENGDWQVMNNKGVKGVIKNDCVNVNEGGVQAAPTPSKNYGGAPSAPVAPRAPVLNGPMGGGGGYNPPIDDDDADDWSMSDGDEGADHEMFGQVGGGSPPIPSQGFPGPGGPMPPGLQGGPQPSRTMGMGGPTPPNNGFSGGAAPIPPTSKPVGGAPVPPQSKPIGGGFGQPQPPSGGPPTGFGQLQPPSGGPSAGFGQPQPPSGGPPMGFGQPTPPTGGPGAGGLRPPMGGGPKPPTGGPGAGGPRPPMGGGPKPPMGGARPPMGGGPKPPGGKKFGGGGGKKKLGGGMPGGGGKPAFLAAINGGNMNKLKKVPDSEKSKEIGGDKGLSATDRGAGKKAKPMGGGGGLMGEMAAAFARRGN